MRIVVGITGATGVLYGVRLLRALGDLGVESHLVMSRWAEATILKETSFSLRQVRDLAFAVHGRDDMGAAISSGSFRHDGMVIVPCSMKTLSAVRHGHCRHPDRPSRRCDVEGAAAFGARWRARRR